MGHKKHSLADDGMTQSFLMDLTRCRLPKLAALARKDIDLL